MQEALRQVAQMEDPHAPLLKPVAEALAAYKKHITALEAATQVRQRAGSILSLLSTRGDEIPE